MEGQEFKAYDRVLVRDEDQERWQAAFYDQYITRNGKFPHHVIGGSGFTQCIPYDGNEHLLGTTDSPEIKSGEPKIDERYFYLTGGLVNNELVYVVKTKKWEDIEKDRDRFNAKNFYLSREEAEEAARIKAAESRIKAFRPDEGDRYFYVEIRMKDGTAAYEIKEATWARTQEDRNRYFLQMCCPTKEDALVYLEIFRITMS